MMKSAAVAIITCVFTFMAQLHAQQVEISTVYLSRTAFTDHDDNRYGKGEMNWYKLKYIQPLSVKVNDNGEPIIWTASLNSKYARLRNYGEAAQENPDEVINAGVNITHIRPLSKKWSLIATIGAGIYSNPAEINLNNILANGGCLFIYRFNRNFSLGAGIGLTNSYGIPMVAPMMYIRWQTAGRFQFDLNISSGLRLAASTRFGKHVKLTWDMLNMDGMSSVITDDGCTRLYSSMMISSFITPEVYISSRVSLFVDGGVTIARACQTTKRKIKYMFEEQKEEDQRSFNPAWHVGGGIRYGF